MSMNPSTLKGALEAAFLANLSAPTSVQTAQINVMSTAIAAAVYAFVQSATINYTAGLAAPGGPVTGIFNSTIT